MDRNLILAVVLSLTVFAGWVTWQATVVVPQREAAMERARALEAERAEERQGEDFAEVLPDGAEEVAREREPAGGDMGRERADSRRSGGRETPRPATSDVAPWEGELASETVRARISNRGGTLAGWQLTRYFESPRQEVPVELVDLPPDAPRALATPFDELGAGDLSDAYYEVVRAGPDEVELLLRHGGVEIRKVYSQPSDDYTMDLRIAVTNHTGRLLDPAFGLWVPAAVNQRPDFGELSLVALAADEVTREAVPSVGSPGFFSRIFGGGEEGPIELPADLAWAGLDMRYFAGVVMPEARAEAGATLLPIDKGRSAAARISLAGVRLAPGQTVERRFTAFFGPKQPPILQRLGDDLDRVVSRGGSWLSPLTGFFEWALHRVHDFVPNYGLAIIVLTVLVRVATWPIMARQMKSAERMRELMPRVKELQEKYKDDRQKLSEETFKLYRETGVNPLGGCFPMLLQLPVFIGLFYALQSSIDLRHAPFFLWINDLSAPATLFTLPGVDFPVRLLPLLMGASMYAQQKMMPQAGMDPAQVKMMQVLMPGMMLVISYTFPSGLVLYWMVSNVLGIAHQLYVRRKMHANA